MVRMTRSKTFQAYLPSCHRTYSCIHCRAHLANHDELISKSFQGSQGRAYLFNSVVNVGCGPAEERVLLTGLHAVADIYCENCKTTLGWKYVSDSRLNKVNPTSSFSNKLIFLFRCVPAVCNMGEFYEIKVLLKYFFSKYHEKNLNLSQFKLFIIFTGLIKPGLVNSCKISFANCSTKCLTKTKKLRPISFLTHTIKPVYHKNYRKDPKQMSPPEQQQKINKANRKTRHK
uniref:Yippee domain-containing protein n=1 Tax=Oryzias latipes TaxID=8090 RepID=A0A3B3HEY2_ORYLA